MAQDVFSKMAEDPWILNEDGYLKVDTDVKEIIYHPSLNVILICTNIGIVRVLDVNSGVILQSSSLSAVNQNEVTCKYIPGSDRVLFCDGQAIGVRSDYNGVLLLDSILQKTLTDGKYYVKLELPLSEAVLLKQSLQTANVTNIDQVLNELNDVILNAQKSFKKGIKAQKWNTVYLNLPLEELRTAVVTVITEFVANNIHTPELQVASAVQERLSELMGEPTNASDRKAMASEVRRRETFSQWPHMDYKWALPEQMAQAGFYHQPNSSGDDRAMCFTCSVCLVCWERTDEPWSEHERHSPTCPFVIGEYTQNVPISVTNATNPAIDATYRGLNINVLGTSTTPNLLPTSNVDGLISVFDVSGKIKRTHSFYVTQFDSHILEKYTQDFGTPGLWNEDKKYPEKKITALSIVSEKTPKQKVSFNKIRPTIVCGLSIKSFSNKHTKPLCEMDVLEGIYQMDTLENMIKSNMESMGSANCPDKNRLYLVVYDFMYSKEQEEAKETTKPDYEKTEKPAVIDIQMKIFNDYDNAAKMTLSDPSEVSEMLMGNLDPQDFIMPKPDYHYMMNQLTTFYKTLIPGESDEVFLPPSLTSNSKKPHTGPRLLTVDVENTEPDSSSTSDLLNSMNNGPLSSDSNELSISDHIADLKSSQSAKKLNYSRAVQCVNLPEQCNGLDLEIMTILTTHDEEHILVVVRSKFSAKSFLLVYALDFTNKMVKIKEESVIVRSLLNFEKPVEVHLLPYVERFGENAEKKSANGIEGNALMVCVDGAVRIVELATLKTICFASIEKEKFVSAAYCNSLDRLCASTKEGSLHFFALNDVDNESVDDHEEDDLFGLNLDSSIRELASLDKTETIRCFREPPNIIAVEDLRNFQRLCNFAPIRSMYNVVVPPCWSEFQQAMRQRRNPSVLNSDAWTKIWRLQTDTTTWDEHIFEITLPSLMVLGHVDVHFTLQSSATLPHVEVTLLRQTKSGIGHNRDVKFAVDDTVIIDMLQWVDNPVVSEEYLRAHNADILAGPINIASHLDLTEQSGTVTLTSPRMFKLKVRNLLLHVRAVYSKDENSKNGSKNKNAESKPSVSLDKIGGLSSRKFYMGCDCIHELSLAIYSPTLTIGIQHEKTLRSLMLESNVFVQSLIMTALNSSSSEVLGLVLDILNWIGSIRLTRNRSNYGEAPNHQLEFMFINGIEENMTGLIRQCLLLGGRSVAHKYMRFIVTCCSGSKNISKSIGEHFNSSVITSLYIILDSITEVKSAAGLQWLFALLLKMSTKDLESVLVSKCLSHLKRLSDELTRRTNPYHLLLRSRYGLYGTPTEPELFDVEPPPYAKGSSILTFVLSDMHDGCEEITNTEFLANYSFNKESINPREVLSTSETKVRYRNAASLKIIKGLIETEPLHFVCVSTSEGTRLERADLPSFQTNLSPILPPVSVIGDVNNKKEDLQQFLHKYVEKHQNYASQINSILGQEKISTIKQSDAGHSKWITQMLEEAEQALDHKLDTMNQQPPPLISAPQVSTPLVYPQSGAPSSQNLPWQQLLVSPPKQVIVVERMHSGARCHVTLDFGESVVLTDILIPSCPDLLSLSIDVWLFGEEIDAVRIVTASDIGAKNLLVNDLQPPALCKFLKITLVGRYGMSTSRCRIPLGYFYGHVVVLPEEVPHDVFIKPIDFEKQLNILSKLFEDISCRYSLACSKLKDLLQPFLTADMKNSLHLSTYMNLMKDKNVNIFDAEHSKIFSAYQETITYQRQLNTVRNVMSRLEGSLKISNTETRKSINPDLPSTSTDKLAAITESLLEVLLSLDATARVNEETCQQLFSGLCISQPSRLQLLSAIFLEKSCGTSNFWGNFLADTLVQMFSTSCTVKFPQDRLFILIAFLSRKSSERSAIIDAVLRVVYDTLKPLTESRSLLLAVNIDLPLLSWLLMFLSLQLSLSRGSNNNRWNWVLGEMVGKTSTDNSKNSARKKTCKRLASTVGTANSPIMSGNGPNSQIQSKLLATWHKHNSNKPNKITIINSIVSNKNIFDNKPKQPPKETKEPEAPVKETPQPPKLPQYIDVMHCLAVARKLLQLILCMDHSASHDMMLLSFKVVSRLVTLAKIQLGQVISENQLLELINFCLLCKIPWAPFALACFLQESMELTVTSKPEVIEMDTDASTSALWPQNDGDLVDSICEVINIDNPDVTYTEPSSNQSKSKVTSSKPKLMSNSISFPPLPSVFESEDSDFEELLEDFEKVRCSTLKNPKTTLSSSSNVSTTIDARLETGVYSSAEITLRRLIIKNTQKLLQNITADKKQKENDGGLAHWPTSVGPFSPKSTLSNHQMLTFCFEELFENLQNEEPSRIEHILHLWLTLNCDKKDDKFDPSVIPQIILKSESVCSLISALAWTPGLTLTTWCIALQTLTLVCNTNNGIFDLSGMASAIVNHKDFVQLFLSFLSGSGMLSSEKALAGPTLCKALHDLLVRLQMRCDIVSSSSKLGNQLKTLLLNVVYQLVKPGGPISLRLGPLDAQCKLLQSMLYLDFANIDISIGMSTLEGTAVLLTNYFLHIDKIKCNSVSEKHTGFTSAQFGDIFDVVLGNDSDKQDRPVCHEDLLIGLLKLLGKLVQTPIHTVDTSEAMDTEPMATSTSQTDESKAEQIQQDNFMTLASMPCFADTVLQHHPTVVRLCRCLAACKSSSLCMLANVSQKAAFSNLSEPNTVGDAVFHILALLAKKASKKELLMQPLLMFLSQTPSLSEPLIWFILQVLDNEEAIRSFYNAGGVKILATSIVKSSNTPSTISRNGTISTVMQHFSRFSTYLDNSSPTATSTTTAKKLPQTSVENSNLINFAPFCTITSHSPTAQTADVLIQGSSGVTHRRARTPLWSYNFYPEETHIELVLQLPSAVLLKEVHLQPHAGGLVTCPSYVSVETSANGPSRLVPACHPLPTSGLTFIRLLLPAPKVVNCVMIRLYKPRVGNSIGLLQIRLLGCYAFDKTLGNNTMESEDESHCNHSLGWLRLLHHCLILPVEPELKNQILSCASQVANLLNTCCGLLLVPSHIMPVYLPCLEKILRELALYSPENGMNTIRVLLENRLSTIEPLMSLDSSWQDKLMVTVNGYQSACELLYQICEYQDSNTIYRIKIILDWLQGIASEAVVTNDTSKCNAAYILCISSILWSAKQCQVSYDLKSLITLEFFESIYCLKLHVQNNVSLRCALNSMLCSICYIRSEFYPLLLQKIGVLVPNLSTDRGASISDDRKDAESMTDDHKRVFESNSEWYGHLVIEELSGMNLTKDQLETVALASRSPTAIQQLLDSGLPKLLNSAIYEFCNTNDESTSVPMAKLDNVTAILQFFTDVSDEKVLRDWLGSPDGSSFWLHLLHWLCKKPSNKSLGLQSEARVHLEEVCVKFLSKCCLCHPSNQARLAKVLCEVISLQQNGISGFLRRLILQLLLENEKVPVSIEADETLYKNTKLAQAYMPIHPAFKQTYNRAMLYLSTNTTLVDILENHVYFNSSYKVAPNFNKKSSATKKDVLKDFFVTHFSDLSMAAGVTAKDKRAKDVKNQASSTPQSKKKRYTAGTSGIDIIEGRLIKCEAFSDQPLPLGLNLGQVLRLLESKGTTTNWPYIHLSICQSKNSDNKNQNSTAEANPQMYPQQPVCSALQVFSSMGGLALLAQYLPTIYPEAMQSSSAEKSSEQTDSDWIKVEEYDDLYEDIEETVANTSPSKSTGLISHIPPHSLTAFSLFLRLPGYAEVLLKDMKKALCLLRLMLGVTDDGEGPFVDRLDALVYCHKALVVVLQTEVLGIKQHHIISNTLCAMYMTLCSRGIGLEVLMEEKVDDLCGLFKGGDIFQSSVAYSLPTLPFEVLQKLYDSTPLCSDDGRFLRRISISTGVVHLLLACLSIFTHSNTNSEKDAQKELKNKEDRQHYWAKGTGFGTGSTQQSWNVEQALLKQRNEEEHVTVLLQVLASYINPNDEASEELSGNVLPQQFQELLANSSLLPVISSYLRNDSVLDMARHIPLYKAVLQILRALAVSTQLVHLLLPQKSRSNEPSVGYLLKNMKTCVDTYASKLRVQNTKSQNAASKSSKTKLGNPLEDLEQGEGLATLMPDIQNTAALVSKVTDSLVEEGDREGENLMEKKVVVSLEEQYLRLMKALQFASYEMIEETPEGEFKFVVSHHFEKTAKSTTEQTHPSRVKRIAQETVTLSTSLPLSYSSSVFVRYDTSRLDVMKVLITGPADTPYANGCFELDVFFPPDYPLSPMLINLETTGHHSVRFNPNLYNDGKVCLSVLNTWHGRPEEKWNAQTSSFLQVLVSIQSLILVPEPYFNEPGYERARGTPAGTVSSKDYNLNICQATVRWAMLDQIRNPCPCFKEVIHAHFYMKRHEIIAQVESWIKELETETKKEKKSARTKKNPTSALHTFRTIYKQLKEQLLKLKPPPGFEEDEGDRETAAEEEESPTTPTNSMEVTVEQEQNKDVDTDKDMEKMVNDMCE